MAAVFLRAVMFGNGEYKAFEVSKQWGTFQGCTVAKLN